MEGELSRPADPAPADAPPLLAARGIVKQYPGVRALDRVDFDVRAGEVHALMGENGAGKTTLIRVLTGAIAPDAGSLALAGSPLRLRSPADAQQAGISAVYQEIDVIPQLSVAENIMLGREPRRFGLIRLRERDRRARHALRRLQLDLELHRPVRALPIAAQQMVAIARALDMQARLLVLDEPTSCLDAAETERLFALMRDLRSRGLGIIFITHFIEQVFAVSDRITVLRNGQRVGCFEARRLSRLELVSHMVGRELAERIGPQKSVMFAPDEGARDVVLRAAGLGRRHSIAPFDLEVRRGEAVGLAGLLGSGRSEAARLIFGADRADSGEVGIGGRRIRRPSPLVSLRAGVGMVPEDRKSQSLIPALSLEENIILAAQAKRGWLRRIPRRERAAMVEKSIRDFAIAGPRRRATVSVLSGGNQQKAVLARWLATSPHVMIFDEPTRGIDVGAKAEIEAIITALRRQGLSMLFISTELEELSRVCSRILIVRDRRIITELSAREASPQRILRAIAGELAA